MSRSNPQENVSPNPATRWYEWNGEAGNIRYYDKDQKKNVTVDLPFRFMLLDRLGAITGWHEPSQSGIWSNEVKDTREGMLVVKAFKEGILAQGLYKDIKEKVAVAGGHFTVNCYIAHKNGDARLAIASLKLKGAALSAWMDFERAHRADLYAKAIVIDGYTEGKKGRVVFRVPTLKIIDVTAESNAQAEALDKDLQTWLKGYFARTATDRVTQSSPATAHAQEPPNDDGYEPPMDEPLDNTPVPVTDDDIPF